MNTDRLQAALATTLALLFLAASPALAGEHAHEGEAHHEEGVVELSPEQVKAAGIEVAPVGRHPLARTLAATGQVVLDRYREVHLSPRVEGKVVRLVKLVGDPVKAGETVIYLDSLPLGEAVATYLEMKAERALATAEQARVSALRTEGIAAEKRQIEANARLARVEARLDTAREQLRLYGMSEAQIEELAPHRPGLPPRARREGVQAAGDGGRPASPKPQAGLRPVEVSGEDTAARSGGMRARSSARGGSPGHHFHSVFALTSPIAGEVIALHATLGEQVGPETPTAQIADLSEVWVEAAVYEKDLGRLHTGAEAWVTVVAYPEVRFLGRLDFIARTVDEETRTTRARIVAPNTDERLLPGMFANVEIAVGDRTPVLAIPRSAVQRDGAARICFVEEAPGHYERREVELGEAGPVYLEIRAGLKEGERVVTQGAFVLKSEVGKGAFGDDD